MGPPDDGSELSEFQLRVLTLVSELELMVLPVLCTLSVVSPCSRLADTRVVAVSRVNTFSPTNAWGEAPNGDVGLGVAFLASLVVGVLDVGDFGPEPLDDDVDGVLAREIISNLQTLLTKSSLSAEDVARGDEGEASGLPWPDPPEVTEPSLEP